MCDPITCRKMIWINLTHDVSRLYFNEKLCLNEITCWSHHYNLLFCFWEKTQHKIANLMISMKTTETWPAFVWAEPISNKFILWGKRQGKCTVHANTEWLNASETFPEDIIHQIHPQHCTFVIQVCICAGKKTQLLVYPPFYEYLGEGFIWNQAHFLDKGIKGE